MSKKNFKAGSGWSGDFHCMASVSGLANKMLECYEKNKMVLSVTYDVVDDETIYLHLFLDSPYDKED